MFYSKKNLGVLILYMLTRIHGIFHLLKFGWLPIYRRIFRMCLFAIVCPLDISFLWWRAAQFSHILAPTAFEQGGIFTVAHFLGHEASVSAVPYPKGRPILWDCNDTYWILSTYSYTDPQEILRSFLHRRVFLTVALL